MYSCSCLWPATPCCSFLAGVWSTLKKVTSLSRCTTWGASSEGVSWWVFVFYWHTDLHSLRSLLKKKTFSLIWHGGVREESCFLENRIAPSVFALSVFLYLRFPLTFLYKRLQLQKYLFSFLLCVRSHTGADSSSLHPTDWRWGLLFKSLRGESVPCEFMFFTKGNEI